MKGRIKTQNFFHTTLTNQIETVDPNDTTEKSFTVGTSSLQVPTIIVVNPADENKRDVIFIHRKEGSTLYYYPYSRSNPSVTHEVGESVYVNDVAEFFNYLFANVDDFGGIKKKVGLNITVYGGKIRINNQDVEVSDTDLTLNDNTTNYIVFDYNDNNIKVLTDLSGFTGILLAEITTSGGSIINIVDKRQVHLNFILDENKLEINSGKLSVKDGTIEPKSHTHTASDITDFDTAVSNSPDVTANTNARHTHSNKSILDNITNSGSGDKFLADDGTYKELPDVTDVRVKVSSTDVNSDYLENKLTAGDNINIEKITEEDGTEKLKINTNLDESKFVHTTGDENISGVKTFNDNIGIGTPSPSNKLTVTGGDIEITDSGKGLILKGEDGNRYKLKVNSSGELELVSI